MNFPDFPNEEPEIPVSFHYEDVEFELPDEQKLTDWLLGVAESEGKDFIEVSYIFCSDERLREMNVEFLDHDYYTDVITFPYNENALHGDIFISLDRVRDNASTQNGGFENELYRVMIHGALHLAGYDDKTPEKKALMSAREDFYLKQGPL